MSAANQTWTMDVAGLKYIDFSGKEHIITTNQTFTLAFNDTGVGGDFTGLIGGGKVTCTDGFTFTPECDPTYTFSSSADGSETVNNGEICFVEEPANRRNRWRVIKLTMANADGVGSNNITSITLEQRGNTARVITWTNIDTA